MTGKEEVFTDDYVAGLLAKDAKESSIKYSALGLEAFAGPSKLPANKPKPNTRFLRNIIKETDSHNAALLAKEAADSRARLHSLAGNGHREQQSRRVDGGDIRRRQLGDIAAILGGRPAKRKRPEDSRKPEPMSRRANTSSGDEAEPLRRETSSMKASHAGRREREADGRAEHRKRHPKEHEISGTTEGGRKRRRSLSPYRVKSREGQDRRHRHRSKSPAEHHKRHETGTSSRRKRDRSASSGPDEERSYKRRDVRKPSTTMNLQSRNVKSKPNSQSGSKVESDSDPLDEIIGPRLARSPEVRSRGRGTVSHASGIDSRFSVTYDPSIDVRLDPEEENDWDQALEALQDRMKWKQQGADRLRAAGFTEDEITKWEKGGEKREEDVKWVKKGEGREWDRGKVLDDDGIVNFDPQFGRLQDT